MSARRVTADQLEALAFDNRQPIDMIGDYAYVTVGGTEYVALIEVSA